MKADRPILILTASAGAGHTVAARALQEQFLAQAPHLPVVVHDFLETTNAFFRALYAKGYLGIVRYAPLAMGLLYEATDRPGRRFRGGLRSWFQNVNAHRGMRFLIDTRPRLIVNTHFLPAEIVAYMRTTRRLACRQVTVTTDFETHQLWFQPPTERYYTATEDGKAYLLACGARDQDVLVTGIPVRRAFDQPIEPAVARQRCGLSPDGPVVLLLCGGFGVGPIERLFDELLTLAQPVQVVAITGRNETLRRRLQDRASRRPDRVRVVGYTDAMNEWMRAADLVVTKPGGLTTSEALVCGLPIVIVNPIPGQETRNSDCLLEHGAAIKVNNPRLLRYRLARLLGDPLRLKSLREAAAAMARPAAARQIVADALTLLDSSEPETSSRGEPQPPRT